VDFEVREHVLVCVVLGVCDIVFDVLVCACVYVFVVSICVCLCICVFLL
jgi:hypothetical protein